MRRAATLSPSTLLGRSDGLVTAAAGTVGAAASGIRGWYARGGRAETTGDATRRDEGSGNKEGDALGAFQRKVDHRSQEAERKLHELLKNAQEARFGEEEKGRAEQKEGVQQKPGEGKEGGGEVGGPSGPEPTRFGDWERKGKCVDF